MKLILGIDEVGRGPWAGPLVIGACVLNPRFDEDGAEIESEAWQNDLKDSKQLTAKKRAELNLKIRKHAKSFGLGWVSANELDEVGLSEALKLATRRAVEQIPDGAFTEIIIDGIQNFLKDTKYESKVTVLKKADDLIKEVSAASILAKVARDDYMVKLAEKYPEYGFDSHVGYGTKKHKQALETFGPCPEHRFSFRPVACRIKGFEGRAQQRRAHSEEPRNDGRDEAVRETLNTTAIGQKAEAKVAELLKLRGHKILARNYKTKLYEIDIVSATKNHIYFTEVKYRRNSAHGSPLDAITKQKQAKMRFAAEAFMRTLSQKLNRDQTTLPDPLLAVASVTETDAIDWFALTD